jgi:hypothetical protein
MVEWRFITSRRLPRSGVSDNFRLADHPGVTVLGIDSNVGDTSATQLGLFGGWGQSEWRQQQSELGQLQIKRVDLLGAYIPRDQR